MNTNPKFSKFVVFILVLLTLCLFPANILATTEEQTTTIPPDLSAHELVSRMRAGWNLGNTFDAWGAPGSRLTGGIGAVETLWLGGAGSMTTQTLIQEVRRAGFDTLRIPVTWSKVADPDNSWQIREDWIERIKTVVDWAMEEDMFVILNTHHENTALALDIEDASIYTHPGNYFITNIWRQIAEAFIDYDERLIFASLNEPRHEGGNNEWWGATQSVRDNVNYLNQTFVDTVRATGGNNVYRILQVPTVAAGATPNGMSDFVVPQDPLNPYVNKIVWSIHTYSPFDWAHDGVGTYPGASGVISDLTNVAQNAERLGLPVILGEWGSIHVSRGSGANQTLRDTHRPVHAEDYVRAARELGMVTIWWDNGGFTGTEHTFGIIRRNYPHEISNLHQELINGIMRGRGDYYYVRPVVFVVEEDVEEETNDVGYYVVDDLSGNEDIYCYETNVADSRRASTLLWVIISVSILAVVLITALILFFKRK